MCFDHRLTIDGIDFKNKLLTYNWYIGTGSILDLTIKDFTIVAIDAGVFNSLIFTKLKTLKLCGFRVDYLSGHIFVGLNALQVLEIDSFTNLHRIDADTLRPCVELRIFEIRNSSRTEVSVNGATGTFPLQNLEIVIMCDNNLSSTITEKTFVGLVQVRLLDLKRNKITSIGPKSFDAIAKTLNMLNLRNNHLRDLPGDIFLNVFLQADMTLLQISLEHNWWHCDCYLQPMQNFLKLKPTTFTGFARCNTPIKLRNIPVQHAILCKHNESIPTRATKSTLPSMTDTAIELPTTEMTNPSKNQLITLKCVKYFIQQYRTFVSVRMQKKDKGIRLRKSADNKFTVLIKDFPVDHTLLWYEKGSYKRHGANRNSIRCLLNNNRSHTRNINLGNAWHVNKVHTFCMKSKKSLTMTPMNCISFDTFDRNNDSTKMWVPKRFRFTAIVLMIVACLLCVLIGVGIVFLLARKYPKRFNICSPKKSNKCNRKNDDELIKSSCQSKRTDPLYSMQNGFVDSSESSDSQFDYIVWLIGQQRNSSVSQSIPPPLPPPHPNQLKRRSQNNKDQDVNHIYCELN